jgi:hydrogenase maturation protein HypF
VKVKARAIVQVRRRIDVSGIVQGVGFRPYVYRLAHERALAGSVRNTSEGVTIELQGPEEHIDEFLVRLSADAPPLARITRIKVEELTCNGESEFVILGSERGTAVRTLISPDIAVCPDCLRELFDTSNRRFRYPFINCTNCGPRFTIVRSVPYDRPFTSMAGFHMCPECQAEYDNPGDRRFHAQPNACRKCGPQLALWNSEGQAIVCDDPIVETVARLKRGEIVAIKGLGGFHLAADARNAKAVEDLRARKHRFEKPLAVMVADAAAARELCEVDDLALASLESPERPIVLLGKRAGCGVAEEVAPSNRDLGVFLPYTPLHHLLFREGNFRALVMTSANLSEEPIVTGNQEAVERLHGIADAFLVHDRDILWRCDDSVVRPLGGKIRQMRRSRGYVPAPVFLHESTPPILAVGGELKNTICLALGREAFLSQHIGDLENLESYRFFEDVIQHLEKVLDIEPEIVAYDLHPDYFSTQWALAQRGVELFGVQHHHAHIASCMAENHLDGRVIGFAFDGTGFGTDKKIWGGEVLLASYRDFSRAAHFEYIPMPGGEQAIRQPWRMAVAYLATHFGREFFDYPIPFVQGLNGRETETLLRMMDHRINSPETSSCGRLFDAVAALIGVRSEVTYEGQAAIELEMTLATGERGAYPFDLKPDGNSWVIETKPLFYSILADVRRGVPASVISARFHSGLVEVLGLVASLTRNESGLDRVCLSGGTFQNSFLLKNLAARLAESGFGVFTHAEVPSGDGGLSLGQVMVVSHSKL